LVEQGIENPRVGGSIPSPATIYSYEKAHFPKWAFSWVVPNLQVFHPVQQEQVRPRAIFDRSGYPGRPQKQSPQRGLFLGKSKVSKSPQS
jgi:hypothetical protein